MPKRHLQVYDFVIRKEQTMFYNDEEFNTPQEPDRGPCETPVREDPAVLPKEAPVPIEVPVPVEIPLTPERA
jgi:hypothetical protein